MAEYSPEQYLASLLTTPEQEARNLRASRSRQRILALGDALRHIGNIYNTTQGAPAQQFNDPVTAERTRYQQDKLLRDANNMKYFTYQQQKRAQDLAMQKSQWDMLNGAAKLQLEQQKFALQQQQAEAKMAGDLARVQEIQARINRINELLPGEKQLQTAKINQAKASATSSYASAGLNRAKTEHPELFRGNGGVNGYETTKQRIVTKTDPYTGKPLEWKDVTTRNGSPSRDMPGVSNRGTMPGVN